MVDETKIKISDSNNILEKHFKMLGEKTAYESSYDDRSQFAPYNPDDLYQKKGGYDIYEDMVNDDQVAVALNLKKDLVLGKGGEVHYDDKDIEKFINDALFEKTDRDVFEMFREILTAYEFGFSISEKIFKRNKNNQLLLKTIKTRHPNTWLIHTDAKGNITQYEQRGTNENIKLNGEKLIHYINNQRFQNPYGLSDLRSAYAAYFTKTQIIRYYAIFLEKAAAPIPVAKYKYGTPPKAIDDIYNALKKFQTKTALTIPDVINLEFLQSNSTGDAYIKGINIFNMFIGRSLFIPDLLGFQGKETSGGSLALGQSQLEIFFNHIASRKRSLERLINLHLIRPLVDYNFGLKNDYPVFKFQPIHEDDLLAFVDKWLSIVNMPWYKPSNEEIDHFKDIINFPSGGHEIVTPEIPINPNFNKIDMDSDKLSVQNNFESINEKKKINDVKEYFNEQLIDVIMANRIDYKNIEKKFDSNLSQAMKQGSEIIEFIYEDIIDQIKKKKILENKRIDRIDSIQVRKLKDINLLLKKNLKEGYTDGKEDAKKEMPDKKILKKFVRDREQLLADEFLKVIDTENFNFVGDWEYNITKGARAQIIGAIKDGTTLSALEQSLRIVGEKQAKTSLERYLRTKLTETYNNGRKEFFNESGVVSGYQYSAILDSSTTEICRGLHGKKFEIGTEPTPPMHFNAILNNSVIETKSGLKRIDELHKGDLVKTHKGNYFKVYDIMNKFEDKYYFEIILESGEKLGITGEHPIFVKRLDNNLKEYYEWVRADEIKMSDYIIRGKDV